MSVTAMWKKGELDLEETLTLSLPEYRQKKIKTVLIEQERFPTID